MRSGITPCYGCEDRTAVCHAKCEMYKAWSEDRRKSIESRSGVRDANWVTNEAIAKAYKKRHLRKK